jgi:hypothetical protein
MAALMENKGLLTMDLYESKLNKKIRAKETEHHRNRIIDSTKVIKSYIRKQIVY